VNIAFLTSEYPHSDLKRSAGLGSSIQNLANGLISQNHNVTIFVVFQNHNKVFYDNKIKIISIARKGFSVFGWYRERKYIQKIVNKESESSHLEIIEAPDWTGITAFMKFGIPLVIRLHGTDAYFCHLEGRQQKRKNFFFEKLALKSADAIVSVSNFTSELTSKLFKLKSKIETIYNGIDVNLFQPDHTQIIKGQLLYFGTLIRKKGILELAHIFNHIVDKSDASLLLIGKDTKDVLEGSSTLKLFNERLIETAQSRVQHIPEVPYNQIKDYIKRANIVVLPSFAEAFPMTWLEALAMEKALVASNIGWANELMIHGETGIIVDPKDHQKYAEFILELLENNEQSTNFGKKGRDHIIENFSTEIILKQNIDFYMSLIDKQSAIR